MIDAAIAYAERGWSVLPLAPRTKRPLTSHGKDDATNDPAVVALWWQRWPKANIGIACRASGFVALDVDPRHYGDDSLFDLERELGALPETLRSITGGGGLHVLFEHPGIDLRGEIAPGVEIKDAGYIVAPPSLHPSGRRYEWEVDDVPISVLPEAWRARARVPAPVVSPPFPARGRGHASDDALKEIPAAEYVPALSGRGVDRGGFVRCPFHKGGEERTPSLRVYETTWACFGCPTRGGRKVGGTIYTFAALLWGFSLPLRGAEFQAVAETLTEFFMQAAA